MYLVFWPRQISHPNGDHYVLRNTGTLAAHDVKFANVEDFAHMRFVRHDGDEGPDILPGQSKAFYALEGWSSPGKEVLIDWQPDGEPERQKFNEVLPPMPSAFADHLKQRSEENRVEAAAQERIVAESRRLLVELAGAWGAYQANASAENKARVQGIVGALPGNFAKEIGYAVDVPRAFWGPDQWPFEKLLFANHRQADDRELVRDNAAMIELIWNLWQVQLPLVAEGDNSQTPRYWYRIEDAVNDYVDLVRRRESGIRELIESPRDRKQREDAMKMLATFQHGQGLGSAKRAMPAPPPPQPEEGGSITDP